MNLEIYNLSKEEKEKLDQERRDRKAFNLFLFLAIGMPMLGFPILFSMVQDGRDNICSASLQWE
jgi:hypothetical protein